MKSKLEGKRSERFFATLRMTGGGGAGIRDDTRVEVLAAGTD